MMYIILHSNDGNIRIRLALSIERAMNIANEIMTTSSNDYLKGGGEFEPAWQRHDQWKWTNDMLEFEYVLIRDIEVG